MTTEIVQEVCRFVMDIGEQIEPVWKEYLQYQDAKDKVCTRIGQVELVVDASKVRFAVQQGAWMAGRLLHDAAEQILSACRRSE